MVWTTFSDGNVVSGSTKHVDPVACVALQDHDDHELKKYTLTGHFISFTCLTACYCKHPFKHIDMVKTNGQTGSNISERIYQSLNQMSFTSRRHTIKSAKNRRLQFTQAHQNLTIED